MGKGIRFDPEPFVDRGLYERPEATSISSTPFFMPT
jgi:hypothetical protein